MSKQIVKVAVFRPLYQLFSYFAPYKIPLGCRVNIPFAKQNLLGIVCDYDDDCNIENHQIKEINYIIDEVPLFSPQDLQLFKFCSEYYHYPLGMVLKSALPLEIRKKEALPQGLTPEKAEIENIKLNQAQQEILEKLLTGSVSVTLLEGLTGSGKSEIYAEFWRKLREKSAKQALFLVPEIGLSQQLFNIISKRTGTRGAIYHSELNSAKKAKIWQGLRNKSLDFVVATRSGIFLNFADLQLIVVDEEHDLSYKQQGDFSYNSRDLAIFRSKIMQIPLILGSATPSLESFHNTKKRNWQHLQLLSKAKTTKKLEIIIDDFSSGRINSLSKRLINAIRQALHNNEQILLFLNRRGYAPLLRCRQCDYQNLCPNCSSSMNIHLQNSSIYCHHCGYKSALPLKCPKCSSSDLYTIGVGTERLELEVKNQFPQANVMRIDSDAYSTAKRFQSALDEVKSGKADIIIGTQWLTKGHHIPRLNLVAIIDTEQALLGIDFRQEERLAQLLIQAGGRAGRESHGTLWVQTNNKNHPFFNNLSELNYQKYLRRIYEERKSALLPPFCAQILLIVEDLRETQAFDFLQEIKKLFTNIDCHGPARAIISKRNNLFRWQLLLEAEKKSILQKEFQKALPTINLLKNKHKIRNFRIDVDPLILD